MISIHRIANYCAGKLIKSPYSSNSDFEVLAYGFELLLGSVFKISCLYILASFFRVTPEAFLIFFWASSYRMLSGGSHCTAYWRCLLVGLIVFVSGGLAAQMMLIKAAANWLWVAASVEMLILLLILYYWVPKDHENKPITNLQERKRFRIYSAFFLVASFCVLGVIGLFLGEQLAMVKLLLVTAMLGLGWQSFSVTPWGCVFVNLIDKGLIVISNFLQRTLQRGKNHAA